MTRRQAVLAAPLGLAGLAGVGFLAMLRGMQSGSFDPRGVPSPITGKRIPAFNLPAQPPGQGFGSTDLVSGKPVLLNFFASWCMPCEEEHAALMALAGVGLPIWAIAYKDRPDAAARFLEQHGNPYKRIASDAAGAGGDRLRRVGRAGELRDRRQWHGALALRRAARWADDRAWAAAGMARRGVNLAGALLAASLMAGPALAISDPAEMLHDPAQEQRAETVGRQLRCLVCQNESIEDSGADLARDLRAIVRQRVAAGDSNKQIIAWMVARYGDFVRLRPPFNAVTALLWFSPLLAVGGGLALALAQRNRRPSGPAPLTEAERARLADLTRS